ncbi:LOW QUALITY PROTEIN: hypothetical protein TorRG33x02_259310 [Trema orientale]|uniref:Transmembrane protein n=1 Tax=Trema orientale TaxID=63057 RepID=A0A2P5D8A0_TREOI|nr:LOW QUALITY PROTEIN: hypothetical protein TorRG33x02_259310 [Trema orientale]
MIHMSFSTSISPRTTTATTPNQEISVVDVVRRQAQVRIRRRRRRRRMSARRRHRPFSSSAAATVADLQIWLGSNPMPRLLVIRGLFVSIVLVVVAAAAVSAIAAGASVLVRIAIIAWSRVSRGADGAV